MLSCLQKPCFFQLIADCRSNSFSLIITMNIQPVKVSIRGDISKSDDFSVLHCNHCNMFQKRLIPRLQINRSCCPDIQLLLCIISGIDTVNGLIKQVSQLAAVRSSYSLSVILSPFPAGNYLSQLVFLSSSVGTNHSAGISNSYGIIRNILYNNAAAANYNIASNGHSGHNLDTCAYPYIISYGNRICILQSPVSSFIING